MLVTLLTKNRNNIVHHGIGSLPWNPGSLISSVFGAKLVKGQKQSMMNQPDEEIERKCKRENNLHILSGFDMIRL